MDVDFSNRCSTINHTLIVTILNDNDGCGEDIMCPHSAHV